MPDIYIIIPCYNEGNRLPVAEFSDFLRENPHIHLTLVNDGSTDNTLAVQTSIEKEFPTQINLVNLEKNLGKAEAVRAGANFLLQNTKAEYLAYFDADLATPLEEINLLWDYLNRKPNLILAFGSRWKRIGATIDRTIRRHYTGRIFATFASIILRMPIYDTQCGAKLLTRSCAEIVFQTPFLSRWLFDVEIFARIRNHFGINQTLEKIMEVPLNFWTEKGDSRIKFGYFLKAPLELLKIKNKYNKLI